MLLALKSLFPLCRHRKETVQKDIEVNLLLSTWWDYISFFYLCTYFLEVFFVFISFFVVVIFSIRKVEESKARSGDNQI